MVVSHDRYFLDKVCNSLWVLDEGDLTEIPGNYGDFQDWKQGKELQARQIELEAREAKKSAPTTPIKTKLTWKETKELEGMEEFVLNLESELEETNSELAEASSNGKVKSLQELDQKRQDLEDQIAKSYERWQELEAK